MNHPVRAALLLLFSLGFLPSPAQTATDVPLANPTFTTGADGLPDGWRAGPGGNGSDTVIAANPSGGVKMTDGSDQVGLGLAQWIDVTPGNTYTATANVEGTGSLQLYLMFVPAIPAKEAEMSKVMIKESHISLPAKPGAPAEVTAVAPPGATKARVWLYCSKAGKCDVVIHSAGVKMTGAAATPETSAATPAPAAASTPSSTTTAPTPAPAPVTASGAKKFPGTIPGESEKTGRFDFGRDHPESMIKPGTLSVVDFETGDFSQTALKQGGKLEVASAPDPVRNGAHSMKVMLTHDQHRAEMCGLRSAPYGEFKYGWSIYLPKEFDGTSWFSIVTQWHSWGCGKLYTITPPGPPTCLVISKNNWNLLLRYQEGNTDNSTKKEFDLGPIEPDRNKWTDFVMEVNWQSPQTGGGYLKLWKNGQQVVDYTGPTWFDDQTSGPFFKMGIYKGAGTWKGEEPGAVAYYDEFRMGDKSISHDAVDPAKQPAH